ncbi:Hypothetical protein NTJ_09784 [Nesidiocoris tenuis]|uniref:Uncharacterized protein n=1 Tax=Nesidiocoris tenuis TaxID=355587 RepID=A0ABN7AXR0_9HEMI|nr:Hypothetical protein NTJ_09784 [Nesidiocoris tenuis]
MDSISSGFLRTYEALSSRIKERIRTGEDYKSTGRRRSILRTTDEPEEKSLKLERQSPQPRARSTKSRLIDSNFRAEQAISTLSARHFTLCALSLAVNNGEVEG